MSWKNLIKEWSVYHFYMFQASEPSKWDLTADGQSAKFYHTYFENQPKLY